MQSRQKVHFNIGIAARLYVTEAAVGKSTLDLPPSTDTHRRALAVLTYLRIRTSMR